MTSIMPPALDGDQSAEVVVLGVGNEQPSPSLTVDEALASARVLKLNAVQTAGGDYAAGDIDKRQGTFYTTVNPTPHPTIERLAHRPLRPRPLRSFLDRDEERTKLLPELRPAGGAWLRGPGGCGLTALLHQVGHMQTDDALPDGVVYLRGDTEPPDLDDIVQGLFSCFYVSDVAVRVTPKLAQTYLAGIKALFLLDHLRLNHDDLVGLTDVLAEGAVLVAADGDAPDTLFDLPLGGLPRREAMLLCLVAGRFDSPQPDTLALLNHLCAALHDMPLSLLLVGRLLRSRAVTLPQLITVLDEIIAERHPPLERAAGQATAPASSRRFAPPAPAPDTYESLALAVQLSLMALNDDERAVLAALVRVGGHDADLAALTAIGQLPATATTAALAHLQELGLVEGEHRRYMVITGSLRRELDRQLPPGDESRRAAAFFSIAAAAHAGDLTWLSGEQANLVAAIKTSLVDGQMAQAGTLAQAAQPTLMLHGQWGGWSQVIEWADQAAQACNDRVLHAWALHERGTRAGLLGNRAAAIANLERSQQLHRQLGDRAAAAISKHNLAYLVPPLGGAWLGLDRRAVLASGALAILALVVVLLFFLSGAPRLSLAALLAQTKEDTPVTISQTVLQGGQSGTSSVSIATAPLSGTVVADPVTGSVIYTPDPNFNGRDNFTYYLDKGAGMIITGTVNVEVAPVNDAPIAYDDHTATDEDSVLTISAAALLANDGDIENDILKLAAAGTSSTRDGMIVLVQGTVVYTPTADFNGTDSFTYTVSDSHGGTATGTVNVAVRPVNDPPQPGSHSAITNQNTAIDISAVALLSTASDGDGDTLVIAGVSAVSAQGGTILLAGDTITYAPAADFVGSDSFTYTISDGHPAEAIGTVSLTVKPPPDALNYDPIAGGDSMTAEEDKPLSFAAADLLANDGDANSDLLAIIGISEASAQGGTVVLVGDTIDYTPKPDFSGADSFSYTISDGHGGSASTTVGVTVTPMNDPPTARGDDFPKIDEDSGANALDVLANDTSDPDTGETLSISDVTQPAHGSLAIAGDGTGLTYTPTTNYNGPDNFSYTISDGNGGSASATVAVTVRPKNDRPKAQNDDFEVDEDSGANALDVLHNDSSAPDRGETLRLAAVTQPAHGSIEIAGGTRLTYTPVADYSGIDSFTYTISDGHGGSDEAGVTIKVRPVNDPPIPGEDVSETFIETYLSIPLIALLFNDRDPDPGDILTVAGVSNTSDQGGLVTLKGENIEYIPPYSTGFSTGIDSFTYQVCDNGIPVRCATGIVRVTVREPPTIEPTPVPTTEPTIEPTPPPTSEPPVVAIPAYPAPHGIPQQIWYDPSCPPSPVVTVTFQGALSHPSGIISDSVVLIYRYRSEDPQLSAQQFRESPVDLNPAGSYSVTITITNDELVAAFLDQKENPTAGVLEYQIRATNGAGDPGYSPLQKDITISYQNHCSGGLI